MRLDDRLVRFVLLVTFAALELCVLTCFVRTISTVLLAVGVVSIVPMALMASQRACVIKSAARLVPLANTVITVGCKGIAQLATFVRWARNYLLLTSISLVILMAASFSIICTHWMVDHVIQVIIALPVQRIPCLASTERSELERMELRRPIAALVLLGIRVRLAILSRFPVRKESTALVAGWWSSAQFLLTIRHLAKRILTVVRIVQRDISVTPRESLPQRLGFVLQGISARLVRRVLCHVLVVPIATQKVLPTNLTVAPALVVDTALVVVQFTMAVLRAATVLRVPSTTQSVLEDHIVPPILLRQSHALRRITALLEVWLQNRASSVRIVLLELSSKSLVR